MSKNVKASDYIEIGDRYILRSALPMEHEDSWFSLWKKKYGEPLPEEIGKQIYGEDWEYPVCPTCGKKGNLNEKD